MKNFILTRTSVPVTFKKIALSLVFLISGFMMLPAQSFVTNAEGVTLLRAEMQDLYPEQSGLIKIYYSYEYFTKSNLPQAARAFMMEKTYSSLVSNADVRIEDAINRAYEAGLIDAKLSQAHLDPAKAFIEDLLAGS